VGMRVLGGVDDDARHLGVRAADLAGDAAPEVLGRDHPHPAPAVGGLGGAPPRGHDPPPGEQEDGHPEPLHTPSRDGNPEPLHTPNRDDKTEAPHAPNLPQNENKSYSYSDSHSR